MPEKPLNKKDFVVGASIIVFLFFAAMMSIFSLVLLLRYDNSAKRDHEIIQFTQCAQDQGSAYDEDAWTALSNALEALRTGDDPGIEHWVRVLRSNESIQSRIKENC